MRALLRGASWLRACQRGIYALFVAVTISGFMGCTDDAGPTGETRKAKGPDRSAWPVVLILGDSLTAGFGVEEGQAWPALMQRHLDEVRVRVINAGVSGDTTSGGAARLAWYRAEPVVAILLALGGNDGLRGIPVETVRENLLAMIQTSRELWPDATVLLAGMQTPPSMGEGYAEEFAAIWPQLAAEEDVPLLPFLLEGVGGEAEFNQDDGIHPNPAGHAVIAEHVRAFFAAETRILLHD